MPSFSPGPPWQHRSPASLIQVFPNLRKPTLTRGCIVKRVTKAQLQQELQAAREQIANLQTQLYRLSERDKRADHLLTAMGLYDDKQIEFSGGYIESLLMRLREHSRSLGTKKLTQQYIATHELMYERIVALASIRKAVKQFVEYRERMRREYTTLEKRGRERNVLLLAPDLLKLNLIG
jgi:hypothetical protein